MICCAFTVALLLLGTFAVVLLISLGLTDREKIFSPRPPQPHTRKRQQERETVRLEKLRIKRKLKQKSYVLIYKI